METIAIYILLMSTMLIPIIQIIVSMNYFKRFAFEYLSNDPISWNPNHDRLVLTMSVIFGLFSSYLAKQIWSGSTEGSWLLTSFYFLLIILLFTLTIFCVISINKDISEQLLNITKSLDGWVIGKHEGKAYDYYQYLTFKIEDGELIEILP